jgi:hypothetical protein
MYESIEDRTIEPGFIHIENPDSLSNEGNSLRLAEVYEPCEGTWSEFKGDVKRFFGKIQAELKERQTDVRESVKAMAQKRASGKVR